MKSASCKIPAGTGAVTLGTPADASDDGVAMDDKVRMHRAEAKDLLDNREVVNRNIVETESTIPNARTLLDFEGMNGNFQMSSSPNLDARVDVQIIVLVLSDLIP